MFDHSELQRIWNCSHQEKTSSERPDEEIVAFAERLRQQLPTGVSLLDAGCGRGRNAIYLSQIGFAVYGCDLSPVAVEIARTRMQKVPTSANFQVADLTRLPYPDNLFAAIVCVHVLPYHLAIDIARSVQELQRVLRPNGWLYFDLLDHDDAEYRCGQELEKDTFLDPDGIPIHFSSKQEVNALTNGLTLQRVARLELKSSVGTCARVAWVVWATKSDGQRLE